MLWSCAGSTLVPSEFAALCGKGILSSTTQTVIIQSPDLVKRGHPKPRTTPNMLTAAAVFPFSVTKLPSSVNFRYSIAVFAVLWRFALVMRIADDEASLFVELGGDLLELIELILSPPLSPSSSRLPTSCCTRCSFISLVVALSKVAFSECNDALAAAATAGVSISDTSCSEFWYAEGGTEVVVFSSSGVAAASSVSTISIRIDSF
mmetsp:Transcript_16142/g.22503  ORF Transcript_16142/g.22503 Transcript_16142/m.22503 type:complete len:206 (-) Transcript_16142:90-707(-)